MLDGVYHWLVALLPLLALGAIVMLAGWALLERATRAAAERSRDFQHDRAAHWKQRYDELLDDPRLEDDPLPGRR